MKQRMVVGMAVALTLSVFAQQGKNPEKEPGFVKKGTWLETLVANREALFQWEARQDAAARTNVEVTLGTWQILGPLPPKSALIGPFFNEPNLIDLSRRCKEGEREIGWAPLPEPKDGQVFDLTGMRGAGKDSVFLLCRSIVLGPQQDSSALALEMSLSKGACHWLPGRNERDTQGTLPILPGGTVPSRRPVTNQFFVVLEPGADGRSAFYFSVRANKERVGAGAIHERAMRRRVLLRDALRAFPDPADQLTARWEIEGNLWLQLPEYTRSLNDWLPGESGGYLSAAYRLAQGKRLGKLKTILAETNGVRATVLEPRKKVLDAMCASVRVELPKDKSADQARDAYYRLCAVEEASDLSARLASVRLAVNDQRDMFKARYPQAEAALRRIADGEARLAAVWEALLTGPADALSGLMKARKEILAMQSEILLDTPLLAFDKLLVAKGDIGFNSNWGGPNTIGSELCVLSPVRPDGKLTTVHKGTIADFDLHWDGKRVLFSDRKTLWELDLSVTGNVPRRVSAEKPDVIHYDGCYLPDGKIIAACNACEQAVPCTGQPDVGNLHLMAADGTNERRVTFDQDHDWNPTVLNDGRVLYTRWEYTDLPHYFSRFLMRMNPDGSGQMEYYGSGSYWPNAMYWPRPIPGDPNAVVCVVSGHHGVSRVGELLILDPSKGRREAEGVVQRIPGYGQKVEPIIEDKLVVDVWPRFAAPYPLAEPETHLGAGKYFLACVKRDEFSGWDVCLVDVFDNITPILCGDQPADASPWLSGGYMMPVPVRTRPMPPVIPSLLKPAQPDGVIYLADIYKGEGLRGYPRGSIKALRVGTHHYRYPGNGDTYASSYEGGWDVKRILGTVPVNDDGSAFFRVPANTPIFVQPLDAEGKSQQQMRSWYTAMPGETASCIGCHEPQNSVPPARNSLAARGKPVAITPWNGPVRGFSFDREVQPVLDRRCAGCHDGQPYKEGTRTVSLDDFRAKALRTDAGQYSPEESFGYARWTNQGSKGERYSPAYMALQKYVRRAGYEADMHMLLPAEFDADTSVLVQTLKKGHHNVRLTPDEWERLYAWIDYNVPYPANWRESHMPPKDEQVARRAEYKKLYAGLDDRDEEPLPLPPVAAFEPPAPEPARPLDAVKFDGWPMTPEQAVAAQKAAGVAELALDLGEGATMKFRLVPAGRFVMGNANGFADERPTSAVAVERPFYLGQLEVTCAQYARFDPRHENGFIEGRGKDRTTRGTPINAPDQPVVRISWNEAVAFCKWLSKKSGLVCTLPSEAQWEWACRAGTATDYSFGEASNDQANIADEGIVRWNYGRCQRGYSDGAAYSAPGGRYKPNAWGLCDMHGNVAEWTFSDYRPYPYAENAGASTALDALKVVRGGSWNDTLPYVTSASRWRYHRYQPVYNVGFRVLAYKQ